MLNFFPPFFSFSGIFLLLLGSRERTFGGSTAAIRSKHVRTIREPLGNGQDSKISRHYAPPNGSKRSFFLFLRSASSSPLTLFRILFLVYGAFMEKGVRTFPIRQFCSRHSDPIAHRSDSSMMTQSQQKCKERSIFLLLLLLCAIFTLLRVSLLLCISSLMCTSLLFSSFL